MLSWLDLSGFLHFLLNCVKHLCRRFASKYVLLKAYYFKRTISRNLTYNIHQYPTISIAEFLITLRSPTPTTPLRHDSLPRTRTWFRSCRRRSVLHSPMSCRHSSWNAKTRRRSSRCPTLRSKSLAFSSKAPNSVKFLGKNSIEVADIWPRVKFSQRKKHLKKVRDFPERFEDITIACIDATLRRYLSGTLAWCPV